MRVRSAPGSPVTLSVTARWYVRRRWLEGESVEALAADYKVSVEEIRKETDATARRAESMVPPRVQAREPESGLRCGVCGTHRYGIGESSMDPAFRMAQCSRCGRRTAHRIVTRV